MELYVNKSIDRRWRAELTTDASPVLFFSPYLTSGTAESVLQCCADNPAEIHTVFEADLFASGASSLAALKNLLEQGHSLFHLPRLHAKLMLVPGQIVTIGSQNLTRRGTRNREASVALLEEGAVSEAEKRVQPWLDERSPITRQMIEDMEELLPPLRRLYLTAQRAAETADEEVNRRIAAREQERLTSLAKRLVDLRRSLARTRRSQYAAYGTVKDTAASYAFRTMSLVVGSDEDLTSWWVDPGRVELEAQKRYLCICPDTGKVGWARVGRTRITFVGRTYSRTQSVTLAGRRYKVIFRAKWPPDKQDAANVEIEVRDLPNAAICHVRVWVDLIGMHVVQVQRAPRSATVPRPHDLAAWIEENEASFTQSIFPLLISPFVYKERLSGVEADEFFGPTGSRFRIRLHMVEGIPVLAAETW